MTKTLYLIFSHTFTPEQKKDARESLSVTRIIEMPGDMKKIWGKVPPEAEGIREHLSPLKNWLLDQSSPGDCVLIQGDFGACFLMVNFVLENGLVPVYSTTRREAVEKLEADGTIQLTHHFKHQRFRKYGE